jgi:hypothetical protein
MVHVTVEIRAGASRRARLRSGEACCYTLFGGAIITAITAQALSARAGAIRRRWCEYASQLKAGGQPNKVVRATVLRYTSLNTRTFSREGALPARAQENEILQ